MKTSRLHRAALLAATFAISLALFTGLLAMGQTVTDDIQMARSALRADRTVVIAEGMQLTTEESTAFWPLYREYRAEMEKLGDGLVNLVLAYADVYPDIPEDRAAELLKQYLSLEKDWVTTRASHLRKMSKVLPKAKVLRLAQLENRLDLTLRLQMASVIPLAPGHPTHP
jgi:hypothetical protein